MADTSMVYRIGANLDELRKNLSEGRAIINSVNADIAKLAPSAQKSTRGISKSFEDATPGANSLYKSFRDVDNILESVGIHARAEVKTLSQLQEVAQSGASSLDTFAKAGLAVGVAMGAWKIGRAISDFFDLDKTIGDLTAKMLGFGDVAAQVAGAQADVLARASKTAGMEIKSLTLAMAINEDAAKKHAESLNTSANRVLGWNNEIAKVKAEGNFALLTTDLKSQNFELKELADRYRVSVDALKFYTNEEKKAADAIEESNKKKIEALGKAMKAAKEAREEEEKLLVATTHLQFAQGNYSDILAKTDPQLVEAIQKYKDLGLNAQDTAVILKTSADKVELVSTALGHQNDSLDQAHEKWLALEKTQAASADAMLAKSRELAEGTKKAFEDAVKAIEASQHQMSAGGSQTYDLSTKEGMAFFKQQNPSATINVGTEYFKTHTLQDAISAGLIDIYAGFKGQRGFADGGRNIDAGPALVGERGPEIVTFGRDGANVTPNHAIGGNVTLNVTVNGVVGSKADVARAVTAEVMAQLRNAGMRVPA